MAIFLIHRIESYLNNRQFHKKNNCSTLKYIATGVPQGSILSPIFFNVNITICYVILDVNKILLVLEKNV